MSLAILTDGAGSTDPRILEAVARLLAAERSASFAAVADAAGVSRATVHRYFRTRGELLAALDLEPDPMARDRVLSVPPDELISGGYRLAASVATTDLGVLRAMIAEVAEQLAAVALRGLRVPPDPADHDPAADPVVEAAAGSSNPHGIPRGASCRDPSTDGRGAAGVRTVPGRQVERCSSDWGR